MAIRKPTAPSEKSAIFAEFLKNEENSVQDVRYHTGSIVEGKISTVKGDDVFVDIGYKSEGIVPADEFGKDSELAPGQKYSVMILALEDDKTGMVKLSKKSADDHIRWQRVLDTIHQDDVVKGTVASSVRGGLIVDVDGIEAFLPGSQVDTAPVRDLAPYIGQTFEFKVIKISNERKNIIISRRELIEGNKAEKRAELLASLQKGELRKGHVKNITEFGAFIDLDGIDGLLHITDMSWGRIKHPSEMLAVGQELEVMVLDVDREKERISLGLKQTTENPWNTIADQFPVGARVAGKVVNLAAYGAFVEIAPGNEGLVHISEFSWTKRVARASDMLEVGQEIDVKALDVDRDRERISLSLKEMTENPWNSIQEQFPVGARVSGKVVNLAAYGAFVEIAPGIEGLVHISEFSWTKHVARASDMLNVGDEIQVSVKEVDSKEQKVALSIRDTQPNPWDTVQDRYPVGSRVKGKVRNFTSYGAFVELEEGIDGMVHVTDMSWTRRPTHPQDCLKKGELVEAVVLEVNPKDQRISLGLKQAQTDPWADISSKYKVGAIVKGKISKVASFGAFVELEDGVDGLVHISAISDQRIEKVRDALKEGDEVEARVIKVDRGERRIGLSIKDINMTEEQVRELEAAAAADGEGTMTSGSKDAGATQFGNAFADAFSGMEWQPEENK